MRLLTVAAPIVLALVISGCTGQQQPTDRATAVSAPNSAAEIGWVDADGKPSQLNDYRGKVVVLDFYATWCQPCRKVIPRLIALQQKYQSKGLQVVGLNVGGPDDRVKVKDFARELQIKYLLGFPTKAATDLLLKGDQEIPQTFIFKPDGQMVARYIGNKAPISDDIEKTVDELMKAEQ
ncbi:MAG TPA: redoxin domain-containing protein [Pyrinomonadaceae bacterium]|nr:redoxin domain-containing protein [Pyrinomonadaceae bacterium]